jgi:hypothetical protein
MASYSSYRKINGASLDPAAVGRAELQPGARRQFGVQWFFGQPCACSTGCCCLWTVPAHVTKLRWEMWGAGGSGHGACSCNRCHHYKGAGGGQYNTVTINTTPGTQYTVCAAGAGVCCRFECVGCNGCTSYVTGSGLSNFCAIGGTPGCANTDWTTRCTSAWECCLQAGANGGDFGTQAHASAFGGVEWWFTVGFCHCHRQTSQPTSAPLIGTSVQEASNFCWMRCGCWTVPYGHGGHGAHSSYCGSGCCGQGGMGGAGLVKVTFF